MALVFPPSPSPGDTYSDVGRTWTWDGTMWSLTTPIAIDVSNVANAVPTSRTISTSGTGLSGGGDLTADRTITLDPTALAGDVAFTGAFVAGQVSGTPALNDVFVVSQVSPLVLEPLDQLQIALLATDMVLLVDTAAPSAGTTVTLPLAGTVNVTVDWGDGNYDTYTTSGNKTHTYASAGQYRVRVEGSLTGFGAAVSRPELVGCLSFGRLGITSLALALRASTNLTQCPSRLPSGVTATNSMFTGSTAFNGDVSSWDVSNVTNMNFMFDLATNFNGDVSSWDVSNVTTMQFLFRASSFNGDVSSWDVSNVTDMQSMFRVNAFQQPLNSWNFVGTVNLTNFMFGKTGSNSYNTADYDDLLVRWDELVTATTLNAARTVNMGGAKYTDPGAGATARAALVTAGWTIVDGGAA